MNHEFDFLTFDIEVPYYDSEEAELFGGDYGDEQCDDEDMDYPEDYNKMRDLENCLDFEDEYPTTEDYPW